MPDAPQTSMFTLTPVRDTHVVAAHTRVLHDGTEAFVAEHVRWNRGGKPRRSPTRTAKVEEHPDQLGLFGGQPDKG